MSGNIIDLRVLKRKISNTEYTIQKNIQHPYPKVGANANSVDIAFTHFRKAIIRKTNEGKCW